MSDRRSDVRVKVCCMQNAGEIRMAAQAGATHVGLVGAMPSGPGPVADEDIARMAASAPDSVTAVLLTSRTHAAGIVAHVMETGVDAVQIVQAVAASVRHSVRQAVPGIQIFQVVHVEGGAAVAEAREAAKGSDFLLLDSGRPSAEVAELGGTGRTHDWSVSADVVRAAPIPVFLAGGLNPENVAQAVGLVAPAGVDLCSGIRGDDGRLDPLRLGRFMEALRP
jgi:phosphoribosylanthranilate isomerase